MGTELEAVAEGPAAEMEGLDCPDPSGTDEQTFAAMIDIAEREAPGTVAYSEWIEELAGSFGGDGTSTAAAVTAKPTSRRWKQSSPSMTPWLT